MTDQLTPHADVDAEAATEPDGFRYADYTDLGLIDLLRDRGITGTEVLKLIAHARSWPGEARDRAETEIAAAMADRDAHLGVEPDEAPDGETP